jgi:hypothetical protein
MQNGSLIKLIERIPMKLKAKISGTNLIVNIEKKDILLDLKLLPENGESFDIDVNQDHLYLKVIQVTQNVE